MNFKNEVEAVDTLMVKIDQLQTEIKKRIFGQDEIIKQVLTSMFSRGHCLLIGVPGLAKTLLVNTIAEALGLRYNRIQFTPDLMPSDIIGTEILNKDREFRFIQGPLFANIILADEINRTPPKTQSALLEAMQEKAVTAAGQRFVLEKPFFVLATQNPIEQEGTYPLPEAQLDRFMFSVWLDYPSFEDELTIVKNTTSHSPNDPLFSGSDHESSGKRQRDALCRKPIGQNPPRDQPGPPNYQQIPEMGCRAACFAIPGHGGQNPCCYFRQIFARHCRCEGCCQKHPATPDH